MSHPVQCVVCDRAISPYGQGTLCDRCARPCPTCGGSVSRCQHPLADPLTALVERDLKATLATQRGGSGMTDLARLTAMSLEWDEAAAALKRWDFPECDKALARFKQLSRERERGNALPSDNER